MLGHFLQATVWDRCSHLKVMSSFLLDSLQQDEKKNPSPTLKLFLNVQIMYDIRPNDVSYMCSQALEFWRFYKTTFISAASCLLTAGESVPRAFAHTAVIGLQ